MTDTKGKAIKPPGTFIAKVAAMRAAQRRYFKSKNMAVLQQSKELEKEVDAMIEELTDKQEKLF